MPELSGVSVGGCVMATKKRLIDANALIEHLTRCIEQSKGLMRSVCVAIKCFVEQMPTVEVVHGRWDQVQRWATKAKYRCSVCGREIMSAVKVNIEKYPYCHCGAKMDGDRDG